MGKHRATMTRDSHDGVTRRMAVDGSLYGPIEKFFDPLEITVPAVTSRDKPIEFGALWGTGENNGVDE